MQDYIINLIFSLNWFIWIINILILFFSSKIIKFIYTENKSKNSISKQTTLLRWLNIIIFLSYIFTLIIHSSTLNLVIQSLFIVLLSYLISIASSKYILKIFWREIESWWKTILKWWYKTYTFGLLIDIILVISVVVIILNIFNVESILKESSVMAWLLAFIWFTSPLWVPDIIAWMHILYYDWISHWSVIKISIRNEERIVWVKDISLVNIKFIDLISWNSIFMRTSEFRNNTVENLSLWIIWKSWNITQYIDIKVDYKHDIKEIWKLCYSAYDNMISNISISEKDYFKLDSDTWKWERNINIIEFADDAIVYRFTYFIKSPFFIIKAKNILNSYLQESQIKYNISFSTPKLLKLDK